MVPKKLLEIKKAEKKALARIKRAEKAGEKRRRGIGGEIARLEKKMREKTKEEIGKRMETARKEGKKEALALKRKNKRELKELEERYEGKNKRLATLVTEKMMG